MQYPLISEYVKAIQDAGDNLEQLAHDSPYWIITESHIAVVVLLPWCLRCRTRVAGNIML